MKLTKEQAMQLQEKLAGNKNPEEIAELAIKNKTGARGLRSIVEHILLDLMYEVPSIKGKKKLVITKEIVSQKKLPAPESLLIDQKTA